MASVRKETTIDAPAERVWDALRDWGALHTRLAPGFAVDTRVEGQDRIVTVFNGTVLRERIVALDDADRRLVWSIVDGPYTHHNGAAQVVAKEGGGCRFVWTTDLLPDEAAERTGQFMERACGVIKQHLEGAAADPAAVPAPA